MCVCVYVEVLLYIHIHIPIHIYLSTLIISIKSNYKNLLSLPIKYHNGIAQSGTINCSAQGLPIVGITGLRQVRFLEHCQSEDRRL